MGIALDSMVSMGCIVSGGRVTNSVLSHDVRINSYSEVENSIVFSHVNVGRYSRIRRAIIDRAVRIPERTEIGYDLEADRKKYHVTEGGIVVVVPEQSMFEDRRRAEEVGGGPEGTEADGQAAAGAGQQPVNSRT